MIARQSLRLELEVERNGEKPSKRPHHINEAMLRASGDPARDGIVDSQLGCSNTPWGNGQRFQLLRFSD